MKSNKLLILSLFLLIFSVYTIINPSAFNAGINFVNEKTGLSLAEVRDEGFLFGLDLQGGAYLLYEAELEDISSSEREERMSGIRDLLEKRINLYGVGESTIQVRGDRISVEIPGAHDLDEAIDMIGETPFLDFRELSEEMERVQQEKWDEIENYFGKTAMEITFEDLMELQDGAVENWEIVLESPYKETGLTGAHLDSARVIINQITQEPVIGLSFNKEGAALFAEITERNIGRPLATFLDDRILQEATVQEKISGGEAQISGGFSVEEAYKVARDLRVGALPVPINLISQQSIGPSLGEDSLNTSIMAGIFGFALVASFMIIFYRFLGVFAVLSLGIYALFVIFLFKAIPVTLTLSGIAGFLLSVGMAIDANILIISRIREELRDGKSLKKSIEEGYKNAWSSIRDGNLTTLIVAIILFFITTSFVRGFAVTLILGILVSLLCSMIIKRGLLILFEDAKISKIKK